VAGSSISYGSFFGVSKLLWEEFYVAKDPWMRALPKRKIKFYFLKKEFILEVLSIQK
jgi:hypothetical protein